MIYLNNLADTYRLNRYGASPPGCLIHIDGESGPLTNFTEVSFKKFLDCRAICLTLDGIQLDIAEKTTKITCDNCNTFTGPSYHRGCYSAFTNKTLIQRAEKRVCKKHEYQAQETTADTIETLAKVNDEATIPKRALRSSTVDFLTEENIEKRRSVHVLPAICIICKKKTSYVTERVGISKIFACM